LGPNTNPQSPIPNPQSKILKKILFYCFNENKKLNLIINNKY